MVYRLFNGKELDTKGIFVAMTDENIFNHCFLNIKTGKTRLVSEEFDINPDRILKRINKKLNQTYFEIPKISEVEKCAWMKEFVESMIGEERLKSKLNFAISKMRDFRFFEKALYFDESGWIWGWVQYKLFELYDKLSDWLEKAGIEIEEEWEYDDDCPLCQLLKESNQKGKNASMKEVKEAFLKAKEGGAIVGGEWLEI